MPGFWWRRRNKPWTGTRFKRRKRYWRKRRKLYRRRRPYKPVRRRRFRRRRRKVRRKRRKIHIQQWQPESIVKCKIRGFTVMVLGADGRQNRCYTNNKFETVAPKTPMGGGFGIEQFTLKYLYTQNKAHNNTWSKSNDYKDLCRYINCKFTFFRHQTQDFIVQYDIQPPFTQTKFTNMQAHPYMLLQHKHHKVILSKQTKTNGKISKTIRIKPPKELETRWFFQKEFAPRPLLTITAAAANMNYSYLQCCNENRQLNILYLDIKLYTVGNWGNNASPYKPYHTAPTAKKWFYTTATSSQRKQLQLDASTYEKSISYNTGWFQPPLLQAVKLYKDASTQVVEQDALPLNFCIYNPALDDGQGNAIYLHSILSEQYTMHHDPDLFITNVPLWLGLFGFVDWIIQKKGKEYLGIYCVCLRSKALLKASQSTATEIIIPIDKEMQAGNNFFNTPVTPAQKALWFPTVHHQLQTINDIVETGPFIPKLTNDKLSTWELKCNYTFNFKWGGPQVYDPTVNDPEKQGFDTSTNIFKTAVQVCNPEKQKTETVFHQWDLRRGQIKESAFKRMYENISSSTDGSTTPEQSPEKKKKKLLPCLQTQEKKEQEVQACLQALFEKNTYQESQDIQQLINQQQQHQEQLKLNIYKLLTNLKMKQNLLQLHTGILD
nr:MAG: ORF1 [Torque teno midi virus]